MATGRIPGQNGISPNIVNAKGDLIVGTADDSVSRLAAGNLWETLYTDSTTTSGIYWAPSAKSVLNEKGALLSAQDSNGTLAKLAPGSNNQVLTADSSTATGLKWAALPASGKLLQVVQGITTTQVLITSTTLTDSGITATITPSSTSSKILVLVNASLFVSRAGNDQYTGARLLRGATQLMDYGAANYFGVGYSAGSGTMYLKGFGEHIYLDSPSTTSATTYKLQGKVETGGNLYFQFSSSPSTITLMEIGA